MSVLRRSFAAAVGLAALALFGWGTDVGVAFHPSEAGLVRLAWRAPVARVETCRVLTAEELEKLPVHMRRPEICEGRVLPFRLRAWIDGEVVVDELVVPEGLREDRPAHVLEQRAVAPGEHRLRVEFAVASDDALPGHPPLVLDADVAIDPRRVVLVTLDDEGERLDWRSR